MNKLPPAIITIDDLTHYVVDVLEIYIGKEITPELVREIEEDISKEFMQWCEDGMFSSGMLISKTKKLVKEIAENYLKGIRDLDQLQEQGELCDKI